jgi:MoxR-like ATPase
MRNQVVLLHEQLCQIVLDKDHEIRLALTCLFAEGHLLIEDAPGVGKTTLVQALAKLLGLKFSRIQFTSDLLPADIVGNNIYESDKKSFRFHPGPVFAEMILADELNRANPKTQSALLQAMEEGEVTVDRETHILPKPFLLIGTQNPHLQLGTFPLPESQLDRFLMSLELLPASAKTEMRLFQGYDPRKKIPDLKSVFGPQDVRQIQGLVMQVKISETLAKYISALIGHTRKKIESRFATLSTRAGMDLAKASRAWAWMQGREMVIPEDVQAVWVSVTSHRMGGNEGVHRGVALAEQILREVEIPT